MIGRSKVRAAPVEPSPSVPAAPAARTVAEIAGELDDARRDLAAREADLQEATAAYEASLDAGREEALAAREKHGAVVVDRDIARRRVTRLEAAHAAAVNAGRIAVVDQIVAKAEEARAAYEAAVRELLPDMGRAARVVMRLWAEAEIAHRHAAEAVKREHGPDAGRFPDAVEAFRIWPGRPREVIGEPVSRVLWTNAAGVPVADEFQARIREQPDGSGRLFGKGPSSFEHRRTFRTETFLAAQDYVRPDPLVSTLCVPAVTGANAPGWTPMSNPNPRTVLATLDALELPTPCEEDRRTPEVEEVPVGLPVQVMREPAPYQSIHVDPDRA